ncbi:MAG: GAF and ANTAR domain-containing protein [Actinobacteria bacterium]|nr:GAF and ANTAR domain-containing protein [Actinomycetota bacterium]
MTVVRQARGSSGERAEAGLARDLSELAREMQADESMEALLQRIVTAAVAEVEGAQYAGISEIRARTVTTRAMTDELVRRIDQLQYDLGVGPCLSSLREQETVRSDDLAEEQRWPQFASAAVEQGVLSMLSVQLFVEGANLGALNLYAGRRKAFDQHDESVAMLLASHAAIAMKGTAVEANLRTALRSRDLIGQAKGILMERFKVNEAQAFDVLVMFSQRTHRKLNDIATDVAATGALPEL